MGFFGPKLVWAVLNPLSLLTGLMVAALLLQLTPWRRLGGRLALLACALALTIGVLPFGALLVAPLEDRFPAPNGFPERVDGIVLLGGATQPGISEARGQPGLNHNGERVLAFMELLRRYPGARAIVSGGSGSLVPDRLSEAEIVRTILERQGIATDAITFDGRSRTTHESAVALRAILSPEPGETWLLVTSAWHMPRAMGSFARQGLDFTAWPVDYRTDGSGIVAPRLWPDLMNGFESMMFALREWTGLAAYRAMGRTDALFPAPREGSPGT